MRKFDYLHDYVNDVEHYINSLEYCLNIFNGSTFNDDVENCIIVLSQQLSLFKKKYPSLSQVGKRILNDLLLPDTVNRIVNGAYPVDASRFGLEFQNDLYILFELEDKLSLLFCYFWKKQLTSFNDFINGEDFRIVGTVNPLYNLPGGKNYRVDNYHNSYLSASLYSNNTISPFNNGRAIVVCEVNENNFLGCSPIDIATRESNRSSIYTIGNTSDGKLIDSGYSMSKDTCYKILVPSILERLRLELDINLNGRILFNGGVNEVILDKTTTNFKGIILVNSGLDCLLDEYVNYRFTTHSSLQLPIKCLNKVLYQKRFYDIEFSDQDYLNLEAQLNNIINQLMQLYDYKKVAQILDSYYNEVVLPMKYDDCALEIINNTLKKHIDTDSYSY